jgi:signal transduction histidine kinase
MRPFCSARLKHTWIFPGVIFCGIAQVAIAGKPVLELTNVLQLQQLDPLPVNYHIHLEGNVWWANPADGKFVLQDATGVAEIETGLQDQFVQAGELVRLEGNGTIAKTGGGHRIGAKGPVVDNNGVHGMIEKSGTVFLTAGWHPIRLDWFNGVEKFGLEVEYEGPGLTRTKIPDAALFKTGNSPGIFVNGLDYYSCEAAGEVLPDFGQLTPLTTGTVSNFDLSVMPRAEHIALRFDGFLKVPRDGLYTFYTTSDDGSQLFVDGPSLRLEKTGRAEFPRPHRIAPGQILGGNEECQWVETEGTVTFASEQANKLEFELSSGTGRMRVEVASDFGLSPATLFNHRIRATGVCQGTFTPDGQKIAGSLLVNGATEIELLETNRNEALGPAGADNNAETLPALTTSAEVHRLKREEAQRGYPVKIRGVVTCVLPEHQAFTIQDSTRGLYAVDLSANASLPRIGEFLEIAGVTDPSLFAPIVNARQLTVLGAGHLPEAVQPTWDQLMNGSLDAQYVELRGIVIAINTNGLTLLTRDGRIKLELRVTGATSATLARYEDALVRVRGCLFASWDYVTHGVKAGEIRIYGADISVDEPAPKDLFAIPQKTAAELLLFDPQASVFQRVKVAGQILHQRDAEFFLTEGQSGVRFVAKKPAELAAGDLVEVVGFPELSGASPVLREAEVRKTGHTPLPPPRILVEDLIRADCDATRVRVSGILVSLRETPAEKILEIQKGLRTFLARLDGTNALAGALPVGARLELTGVYAAQGGNKAVGQSISSFELLLNSPVDIKVLARPPWWTLERLLFILGSLACVLVITVLWITLLHRKVEERSAELEAQIRDRQRVEQQRALEQERARIAQDLHDELGSGLTEVSMLGARARAAVTSDDKRKKYLGQMSDKALEMVAALDEIVWAMNPRHDSLESLVSYFSLYADRFLGLANVAWRLEPLSGPPEFVVDSRCRHQLFLVFKEALTNVVRHSGATEVRWSLRLENDGLRMSISDNGHGLPAGWRTEGMDGVANMRARLEKMGGQFEIISNETGRGATVRFFVPAKSKL